MAAWGVPPTIEIASIGIPDTLFLMLLALVVFGPRRLPEIGRQIGKLMYEFRKVSNDFKYQMEEELRASEEADRQRKAAAAAASQPQASLDIPPQPSAGVAPLELGTGNPEAAANIGAESLPATLHAAPAVDAVEGEVRAEPQQFPQIQPPATGDPIAAQKPFRGRATELPTESGDAATRVVETQVIVADEGRVGTEVQPSVSTSDEAGVSTGQEVHHA